MRGEGGRSEGDEAPREAAGLAHWARRPRGRRAPARPTAPAATTTAPVRPRGVGATLRAFMEAVEVLELRRGRARTRRGWASLRAASGRPLLLAAAEHAELRARAAAHFVVADADGDGRLTVAVDEFFSQARAYYFLPFGWQGRERLKHCGALAAAAPGAAVEDRC